MTVPITDAKLERLFAHLHRGGSWAYYWTAPDKKTAWHQVGRNGTLPKGANIYFGVHPTHTKRSSNQRARAIDICAVNCLFAEFDAKDFGDSKAATLAHIHGLALPPSVIVDSGGGFHCYWLLDEPYPINGDTDRERIDRVQKAWVAFVGSDDGAKDLARVLRVPGTTNGKYTPPRPVTFHSANFEDLYDLADLELISFVPPTPTPTPADPRNHTQVGNAGAQSAYARAALNGELARVRSARPTTRNTTLNKAAYAIGQLVGAGALDQRAAERDLLDAALSTGLSEKEALRTIQSGLTAGIAKPRQIPQSNRLAEQQLQQPIDMNAAPEDEPTSTRTFNESTCTDTGNADRFAKQHGANVRYVPGWGWVIYTGKHWEIDEHNHVIKLAKTTARSIYVAASEASSDEVADKLAKWAKESLSRSRLESMVALARPELPASTEDFDTAPYTLNCQNGMLDLLTGNLKPHDPKDMCSRVAGVKFNENAHASRWYDFLPEIFDNDADMVTFVRRWMGYSMTGDTCEQRYMIAWGGGANGKSTLFDILRYVLGDYAVSVTPASLAAHRNSSDTNSVIAQIPGARLAICPEWHQDMQADESLLKDLTGGDPITVRTLYQKPFTFKPQAKIVIYGNHKPQLRGTDGGTWRRPVLTPFTRKFEGAANDKTLGDKLKAEAEGILVDLLLACREWRTHGLSIPASVISATEAYRKASNDILTFVEARCIQDSNARCTVGKLHTEYLKYGGDIKTPHKFGDALREAGYSTERTRNGYEVIGLGIETE